MEGYQGSTSPTVMYVRALYDYSADDPISLSFRQGDIVQVLTQLDSGWWDGIIRGVRGWFPSNYCAPILLQPHRQDQALDSGSEDADLEIDIEDDYENEDAEGRERVGLVGSGRLAGHTDQEEAAFWIPQATPDGKLFYFNTLTGDSTMELPLESPSPVNDSGPRDSANAFASDLPRPPAEMMAAGYEREEESEGDHSASDADEPSRRRKILNRDKRRSYISDGASPATSMESLDITSSAYRSHADLADPVSFTDLPVRTNPISFMGVPTSIPKHLAATQRLMTNAEGLPLTWNRMVEDMRRSAERYRQVINQGDNDEYVRRVEDLSDHLKLVLSAGSGTTDSHSGSPSIISSNKALYPHFRDMMSRFSKLVLSSHIAASDWCTGDTRYKCLQEVEGVLNAVYGYVEVARQQSGEEIPRLFPGFVAGKNVGGSWRGNGMVPAEPLDTTSFVNEDEDESNLQPTSYMNSSLLEKLVAEEQSLYAGIQALAERLVVKDKLVTPKKHKRISDEICDACGSLLDLYGPWIIELETINFSDLNHRTQTPQIREFDVQKQRVYSLIADMILACQAIGAPLADEWASDRGKPLEDRIFDVQASSKDLQRATTNLNKCLRELYETTVGVTQSVTRPQSSDEKVNAVSAATSSSTTARSLLGNISQAVVFKETSNPNAGLYLNVESSKVKKFFGEVPVPGQAREGQDTPNFLRLDYEGEVQYDSKTNPPTIRGGTMIGLVEQLTRHDRYDSPYNNTFLLTYQSFTNAIELFELLVRRWNIQPPTGLTKDEYAVWIERKQAPIRFRIVNVLKSWLDTYWMEENDIKSKELVQRVYHFAINTVAASSTPGARPLIAILEQRMRGEESTSRRLVPNSHIEAPTPILPKNMKKLKFLDIDPTEFARQLTIIESRLYGRIKPHECLNKIWQKKNVVQDFEPASNVKSLILHSNRLTNWVAETILGPSDVKKRVAIVKHFVAVADKCLLMYNFSTLTSIISAFATAPIARLNRTWSQVNGKTIVILERLRKLMGNTKNFAEYREALHLANPPCIPFFGVYLTDLTFIEDGIPSIIKKTDLINFSKRAKTAEVIREIQTYQNSSYPFRSIPEVQDYILSMMQSAGNVHEMYEKSLQIEPREREDEKIARLLSESGFL